MKHKLLVVTAGTAATGVGYQLQQQVNARPNSELIVMVRYLDIATNLPSIYGGGILANEWKPMQISRKYMDSLEVSNGSTDPKLLQLLYQGLHPRAEGAGGGAVRYNGAGAVIVNRTLLEQWIEGSMVSLAQTYTLSTSEREALHREALEADTTQKLTLAPTLQEALGSVPLIQQSMSTWENDDPETPLIKAQVEARQVLSSPQLFLGPREAMPRAKLQLKELAKAIGAFQVKHKQSPIDLEERRKTFVQFAEDMMEDLQSRVDAFPLLATVLRLKGPMAWLTLLLLALISAVTVILGFAWLRHCAFLLLLGIMTTLDATLFTVSFFTLILWTIVVVTVLSVLFGFRNIILNKGRSSLNANSTMINQ